MEVTTFEDKLLLSSRAMENASHQVSLQIESLKKQLHIISKQREDIWLPLSLSLGQEKQYSQALANMKLVLMAKTDHLEGKLVSAHKLQEEANAALGVKEEQIKDLKKQTEFQQEVLNDVQETLMNLIGNAEGKVDKRLMRNFFMGYFFFFFFFCLSPPHFILLLIIFLFVYDNFFYRLRRHN